MLNIQTFDARQGGNGLYKALAHPLAAEAIARLYASLRTAGGRASDGREGGLQEAGLHEAGRHPVGRHQAGRAGAGPVWLFDPEDLATALLVMHPDAPPIAGVFVQDIEAVGAERCGHLARPITDLPRCAVGTLLIAAFDTAAIRHRLQHLLPEGAAMVSLDDVRLPETMLTNPRKILDPLNYATNYAFFRDADGLGTRLTTANYWFGYGARAPIRLWCRLFAADGAALATWEQTLPPNPGGFIIDSGEVRARFDLPAFTGQLFLHAIGVAGHDVVKYALDTYANDGGATLSCTHDANAWPADRYAGLPAPRPGERVILWVQNSHATAIPAGAMSLDRMGAERPVALTTDVPPYASLAIDVGESLPGLRWPAQIEFRAGRHLVRPRYEIVHDGRARIAHVNVERADLVPDPGIRTLSNLMGRGYLLPFPILPADRFRTIVQPTPMATTQRSLPIRLDLFAANGRLLEEKFLGDLPRDHDLAVEIDNIEAAHGELVYDFRDGGDADGWLHTLVRFTHRDSGHAAETSFGAHIYNTPLTYKGEPQSYRGAPPGLTTRLFLKLGDASRDSFTCLIYPVSSPWHAFSDTHLLLHDSDGEIIAEHAVQIACSGSAFLWPHQVFGAENMRRAGHRGYVLIRDTSCRLFGYHGLMDAKGGFSLDHMFGF